MTQGIVDHNGPPRDRSRESGHVSHAYKPLRGRCFVRPDEAPERTPTGLWLPQTINRDDDPIHFGTVVAVGAPARDQMRIAGKLHTWEVQPEYKVGDRVAYVFAVALKKVRALEGLVAVAQEEIQALIEP